MKILNAWLVFSLMFLFVWLFIFILNKKSRKEMLWASVFTMPFGLTEPLFVPLYWNPPSLFDLAAKTGFDIESLIFSFAIGGIGAVLYEMISKVKHIKMSKEEIHNKRHKWHLFTLFLPIFVFGALFFLTSLNPIYSAAIAMFGGGISALYCRPDLKNKIFIGGFVFLALYFIFFFILISSYPGIVRDVWNLGAISGVLIFGIPIEELIFAITFGMLWSSYYEHIKWYKLRE